MRAHRYLMAGLTLASLAGPGLLASSSSTCITFQIGSAVNTLVTGINNKGQIVGTWADNGQPSHAFVRNRDGTILPLVSPTGSDEFSPVGINNLGQIAGPSFILNSDGTFTDVAPAVAPPGHTYQSTQITGINDKGELSGTIVADLDSEGDGTIVAFIRGTDGKYRTIDQSPFGDPEPTIIMGPINNAGVVIEHTRYTDGYLLNPSVSRKPLLYPGLPFDSGSPGGSTFTEGLNNSNVTAGSTHSDIASNLAFIRTVNGHYPEVVCEEAGNPTLIVGGINDQNVVAGTYFGRAPSGQLGQFGFVVTPTGVATQAQTSNQSWTFATHPVGQASGLGKIFVTNTGKADLHVAAAYIGDAGRSTDHPTSFVITNSNCAPVPAGPDPLPLIPPGASCFVNFQFTPRFSRFQTATLYIPSDSPDSPLAIQLGGTGVGSVLKVSNTSWRFSAHTVNQTSGNGTIYFYNQGPVPVTFGNIQIVETGPTLDFRLLNTTCGTNLPAYKTCSATFNFTPMTAGQHTASLSLGDNSQQGPIQIPLFGVGK